MEMENEGLGEEPLNRPKWKKALDWYYFCNINFENEFSENGEAEGYSCYDSSGYLFFV